MSFNAYLIDHETFVRMSIFIGMFVLMSLWEMVAPRRVLKTSKPVRWTHNIALTIVNILLVRVVFPWTVVSIAVIADKRGVGLLHGFPMPYPVAFVFSLLALDLSIYLFHIPFHFVPTLWRVHRVHHTDLDFDVSTGARFHPVQPALSILFRFAVVLVLGPPVLAVVVFEAVFHAMTFFNHANIHIPVSMDRVLRWFVMTPDMHRVHHSMNPVETNSNFGFTLPWWDYLFGTYRAQPAMGHARMTLGIEPFHAQRDLWIDHMLLQPLRDERGRMPSIASEGGDIDA